MIGLKKKLPFSLQNALLTDFGLRLAHHTGTPVWKPQEEGLRRLGVQHAIVVANPISLSPRKRTDPVYSVPHLPKVDGFSTEVVPSYELNAALGAHVQKYPLTGYRDKYVMLTLQERVAVRELKGPIFELRARGYEPVILYQDPRKFSKLKVPALEYLIDLGCLLQLDLMALTGAYGLSAKAQAETLLNKSLVHVLTTGITGTADADLIAALVVPTNVIASLEQALVRHAEWLTAS